MLDTTYLKKYIESLEFDRSVIDEHLREARQLLDKAEGRGAKPDSSTGLDSSATAEVAAAPQAAPYAEPEQVPLNGDSPFRSKYGEVSAKQVVLKVLHEAGNAIDRGKIQQGSEALGYEFTSKTYDLMLIRLRAKDMVEQLPAPPDSKYKNLWRLTDKGRSEVPHIPMRLVG